MARTAWMSLHHSRLLGEHTFVGLDNYEALLRDAYFWNAVRNTFAIFFIATVPQLMLALYLATLLNKPVRARTFVRMAILVPNVTSVAAVAIVFGMPSPTS